MKYCSSCGKYFEPPRKNSRYCSEQCKVIERRNAGRVDIQAANARWIARESARPGAKSPGRLDKQEEWKRLYDDNSWLKRFHGGRT